MIATISLAFSRRMTTIFGAVEQRERTRIYLDFWDIQSSKKPHTKQNQRRVILTQNKLCLKIFKKSLILQKVTIFAPKIETFFSTEQKSKLGTLLDPLGPFGTF